MDDTMLLSRDIRDLIDAALAEDVGQGDPTTDALIEPDLTGSATLVSRDEGIIAGIGVAVEVFTQFDSTLDAVSLVEDGSAVAAGERLASVSGSVASILKAERTAVNFLQHLSGIATLTRRYVNAVQSYHAQIVDTRKTIPGLRKLEKHAVAMGGGRNHRYNLADGILIKDNHIEAMELQGIGIGEVVKRAHAGASHMIKVEIEAETLEQIKEVLSAGADLVLLDNMDPEQMETAVRITDGRALLEASGGITLDTVRDVASAGVDIISVGALTHSAPALNISLDMVIDS